MKHRVLIVEDDPVIAFDIRQIIEETGEYEGRIAADKIGAMAMAKEGIDIALCDIRIKGEADGVETAAALQKAYGCAVLFLTSYNDESTLRNASAIEYTGYLLKPFAEAELLTNLRLCSLKIVQEHSVEKIGNGYRYDRKGKMLLYDGKTVVLSPKEHSLLLLLLDARGQVVPFAYLDEIVWGAQAVSDTTRRQLFHRLRNKLLGLEFKSVKFAGYMLER